MEEHFWEFPENVGFPTSQAEEWDQLAHTCRQLPKLKGLKIVAPSVSLDHQTLSLFDAEMVEGVAMDGRENLLAATWDRGLWPN